MRHFISRIIATIAFALLSWSSAWAVIQYQGYQFETNGGTIMVIGGKSHTPVTLTKGTNDYSASLPSTFTVNNNRYVLTAIGANAFKNLTGVHSFTLTMYIQRIGSSAFEGCTSLSSIYLVDGNRLSTIDQRAFYNCSSLKYFYDLNTRKEYSGTPFKNLTTIAANAFYGCSSLTSFRFPSTLKTIGNSAFSGCTKLERVYGHPDITTIENYAFYNCTSLAYFYVNGSSSSPISNLVTIGSYAFQNTALKRFDLSSKVTGIGTNAFYGCKSLDKDPLFAATGLQRIGASAFENCTSLTSVSINSSVTYIGDKAFCGCSSLMDVSCGIRSPLSITQYTFSQNRSNSKSTAHLSLSDLSRISDYKTATGWKEFTGIDGEKLLYNNIVFYKTGNSYRINSVKYEEVKLGHLDLSNASTSITVKETFTAKSINYIVTQIADNALKGNMTLNYLYLPYCIFKVGDNAFAGSNLKTVTFYSPANNSDKTINNEKLEIGYQAFYNCQSLTTVKFPSHLKTIGTNAFHSCSVLSSVNDFKNTNNVPCNVQTIGNYAFFNCSKLQTITIPSTVKSIGDRAFCGCSGLQDVVCELSSPLSITQYTFSQSSGNSKSTADLSLSDPSKISSFNNATGWKEFKAIHGKKIVYNNVTYYETGKTYTVNNTSGYYGVTLGSIPKSSTSLTLVSTFTTNNKKYVLAEVSSNVLDGSSSLTSLTLPYTVFKVSDMAFQDSKLKTVTFNSGSNNPAKTINSETLMIGTQAFYGCKSLTSVKLPSHLNTIGTNAFRECTALSDVNLKTGNLQYIYSYAFYGCSKLQTITIPSTVKSIGDKAFCGCSGLQDVVCELSSPLSITQYTFSQSSGNSKSTAELSLSDPSKISTFRRATGWQEFKDFHGERISLGGIVCYATGATHRISNKDYRGVTIAKITTSAGRNVSISSTFPNGSNNYVVTHVSANVMGDNTTSKTVTLPSSLFKVEAEAFMGSSIQTVTFSSPANNALTTTDGKTLTIDKNAFQGCKSLTTVKFPAHLAVIGYEAFKDCSALKDVGSFCTDNGLQCAIKRIETSAFENCSNLNITYNISSNRNTYLPSLEFIGSYAFHNCTSLSQFFFSTYLNDIGTNAFEGCTGLTTLYSHPSNPLTSIPNSCFKGCSKLSSFYRSYYLDGRSWNYNKSDGPGFDYTTIAASAFEGCTSLKEFKADEGLKKIGNKAFYGCSGLTTFLANEGLQTIGSDAFRNCSKLVDFYAVSHWGYKNSKYTFPSLTEVGDYALSSTAITTFVASPTLTTIGNGAFRYTSSLTTVELNEAKLKTIGDYAFYNCSGLKSLLFQEGLTSIGTQAFYGCSYVKDLVLPSTVTKIGDRAFFGLNELGSVTCKMPSTPPSITQNTFYRSDNSRPKARLYVTKRNLKSAYQTATGWREFPEKFFGDILECAEGSVIEY